MTLGKWMVGFVGPGLKDERMGSTGFEPVTFTMSR